MKKIIIALTILLSTCLFANSEDVLGKWITEKAENGNQIIVEIYKTQEGKYNGKIYVPTNGKTYNSYMKLREDGTLLVKGSIDKAGILGKKQIWTRYEK